MSGFDPDQLLKSLEAEIALSKARHSRPAANRNAFRILSIMIFVLATIVALVALQYMASQLPAHPAPKPSPTEVQDAH